MNASDIIRQAGGVWPEPDAPAIIPMVRVANLSAEEPEQLKKHAPFWARVLSFLSAVTGPRCDDDEYRRRISACIACDAVKHEDARQYCGACGCGSWRLAELETKLRFQNLECPLEKW